MTTDRRQQLKELELIQTEAVWLQKALFALRKASAAREKLANLRDEEAEPLTLPHGRRKLSADQFEEALEDRIQELLTTVRQRRRNL
jgi:hypothetical protein